MLSTLLLLSLLLTQAETQLGMQSEACAEAARTARSRLKGAQAAWKRYRDAELDRQRLQVLTRWLNPEEGDVCH